MPIIVLHNQVYDTAAFVTLSCKMYFIGPLAPLYLMTRYWIPDLARFPGLYYSCPAQVVLETYNSYQYQKSRLNNCPSNS